MTSIAESSSSGAASPTPDVAPPKPRYDWADPAVPIGNAPPMPRWRVALFGLFWVGWLVFLLAIVLAAHRQG